MEKNTKDILTEIKNFRPQKSNQYSDVELNTSNSIDSVKKNWILDKDSMFTYNSNSKIISVFDAASYILRKTGEITTMKLHKLLYYAQAWSLVWDDKPLFSENIEAWANGPAIRELFDYHKGHYSISNITIGNPDLLDSNQKETINSVLNFYGGKSSQWLVELTHMEEPWKNARMGLSPTERGNKIISLPSILEYYSSL